MGVHNFLLRSGPDKFYTDKMLRGLIAQIREHFPGRAVALALGERDAESLRTLSDPVRTGMCCSRRRRTRTGSGRVTRRNSTSDGGCTP